MKPIMIVIDTWFLEDLIRRLTPGPDEEVVYLTGMDIDGVRTPYRICNVDLERQSVAYARGTARSCMNALMEINRRGFKLQIMAHSHPGRGAWATSPSSIDMKYLGTIQKAGAEVAGIIVTRDGHVRFFTVYKPFEIDIQGSGVEYVDEQVVRIPMPDRNKNQDKEGFLSWSRFARCL